MVHSAFLLQPTKINLHHTWSDYSSETAYGPISFIIQPTELVQILLIKPSFFHTVFFLLSMPCLTSIRWSDHLPHWCDFAN